MLDSLPQTSLLAAFLAGLLSFVSPCVLPLVPSYLMYITGLSLNQLTDAAERRLERMTIVVNALLFIAGFSLVFIAFGASASLIGQLLTDHQQFIRKAGGILIIVFGLYTMGLVKLRFLMTEKRIHLRSRPAGYAGSLLIGATFAAGWTPCVGPVLGAMLMYASTTDTLADGVTLLAFYSIGLGLPLFTAAMGMERFLSSFKRVHRYIGVMSSISGVFLVVFGLAIYSDSLTLMTSFLERYGIGSYLGTDGG
ncbi:Cytochrome c biogenesis protein CcdA [Nitrospira japonica]|uniref:Cytochrome c biogenesis protein CcdA n=1 Tax=Nitrospira japonica TaxID=1325564 RepID=A0A1W1I6V8_9BACT|nr:cytochrome c biogenesis protein CcdA [Nitrospira japonica]SLM48715.1 Cytochrome c biogenesis protein CcdA [Nitrospira japonica]